MTSRPTYARLLSATLLGIALPIWILLLARSADVGVDFYPLYFAAGRVRAGLSFYGADATAALARVWTAPFAAAGIAYPLPLVLLVVPLSLLPLGIANCLWTAWGGATTFAAIRLAPEWRTLIPLPLLFLPFFRSAMLGQATLVWFGLAALALLGMRARTPWLVGVACALLLLKPQNGLIFAIAGLLWSLRHERRGLLWFAGASLTLWGLAFAIQPGWLGAWVEQVQLYQRVVAPPSLLPAGALLLLACWRLPWWALAAAAQVVLFPLSDLYSALPLLFCWVAIGGPLALVGAGSSWLWSLLGLPNSLEALWLALLWPLVMCATLRTWLGVRRR